MQRRSQHQRLRARPAHSGPRRSKSSREKTSTPASSNGALVELHGATDAEGVFRAARTLLRQALGPCSVVLSLRSLPSEAPRVYGAAQVDMKLDDFGAWLAHLDDVRRRRKVKVVRLSDLSGLELARSGEPRSRARLRPSAALLGFDGCGYSQAALLVMRSRGVALGGSDLLELRRQHPHFATALRGVRALQREHVTRLALQKVLGRFPVGVLLLDWDGSLLYKNSAAIEACARWNFGDDARSLHAARVFRLPKEILKTCRALAVRSADESIELESASVSSSFSKGARAVVQTVRFEAQPLSRPRYFVHFESPALASSTSERKLSVLMRLTPREREIVELLTKGYGNAEMAQKLGKSLHTVKKQLQGVFRKLAVSSRAKLIASLAR
jgi:DNA-binding CsgD family transcriptional regulator